MAEERYTLHLPDDEGRWYRIRLEAQGELAVVVVAENGESHRSVWDASDEHEWLGPWKVPEDIEEPRSWFAWFARGVMRMYLRRFPTILEEENGLRVGLGERELKEFFLARAGGTALERVERDLEDILVELGMALSTDEIAAHPERVSLDVWTVARPTLERMRGRGDRRVEPLYPAIQDFYTQLAGALESPATPASYRSLIARAHPLLLDIIASAEAEPPRVTADRNGRKPWPGDLTPHIHRIELKDVRCFKDITLELTAPDGLQEGQWLVLLGENGQGKTTLLRALALALLPLKASQNHVYEVSQAAPLIRHGASRATVRVDFGTGATARIALELDGRTESVASIQPPVTPLVLGYGCRRGSALGDREGTLVTDPLRGCDTLFDEHAQLANAHYWLLTARTDRPELFDVIRQTLMTVLDVEDLQTRGDATYVTGRDFGRVPLAGLSDGYLTTLGWVVDLIARWWTYAEQEAFTLGDAFHRQMPCVVLIDEIDLHLHPRWQARVVERMRALFPMTTFIATTHNPLALTGLAPHEIAILHMDEETRGVVAERPTRRPDLLTSSEIYETFFGVRRRHLSKLQRYGFLAGDPYLTDDEHAEMERLREELTATGLQPEWEPVPREPLE